MSAPIINRPLRQSWPNRAPAPGPAPMPSPMPSLSSPAPIVYPQSVPSIWYPAPRMSASATPQFAPQPPQPMPQAQQTEQSGPLITVVMRPNYGIYSIPISSYPFGMVPLQMAQAPPPNTIVSTPSVVSSIEILPASSSASADSSDSHNTPIIPFVSNGARQPTPTNTVQSPSKEKSNHINAHGIVSILQEVFHIPPSAISIDGKPIDITDMGAKEGRGSIGVSKNNKHGDDDNDNDDDSDNDAQDSGDREQDLELDSRYNLGEIARNRRKVRSKVKAVGRVVKTLTKKESRSANDNSKSSSVSDEGSNGDSVRTDQSATATSTSPAESADKASNISTSMNLASHDGALLSVAMSDTTLSAAIKVERADDDDDSAPASQTDDD
ncbi:hypothetical protein GGF44_003117 [Coemansia sp. RSA 1694]|nr:hypothetical protein GGF44_003117 [Coemansia sp. RSA 1694]